MSTRGRTNRRSGSRRKAPAWLLAMVALLPGPWGTLPADATTLIPLTLEKLTRWSDLIVLGRCEEVWGTEEEGIIRTRARFRVTETWKGKAPEEIILSHVGGAVGRRVGLVPGTPRFEPGEENVLFLQAFPDGTYAVVGLFQGKFRIVEELGPGEGGARLVGRDGGAGNESMPPGWGSAAGLLAIDGILRPDGTARLEDFEGLVRWFLRGEAR